MHIGLLFHSLLRGLFFSFDHKSVYEKQVWKKHKKNYSNIKVYYQRKMTGSAFSSRCEETTDVDEKVCVV